MTKKEAKRIGRPMKPAPKGTRVALGVRVTAEIKRRIDSAVKATGRTQSQEAERLIEMALEYQRTLGELEAFKAKARAERVQTTPPPTTIVDQIRAHDERIKALEQQRTTDAG